MAKIFFIKPSNNLPYNYVCHPLGLLYLTSALRTKGNHEIELLDMRLREPPIEDAVNTALAFNPDIIGFSTLSLENSIVAEMVEKIKAKRPEVVTVMGGPHVSTLGLEILDDPNIDYLVFGEGEETFPELVDAITDGKNPAAVKGIGYRENGEAVKTEDRELILDLDTLNHPAWDILDIEPYYDVPNFNIVVAHRRMMPIFTTRGCPYQCTYCHNIFGKKTRMRSAENVLEEIQFLHDNYGIREFQVIDDVFNISKQRAEKICDLIINSGMKIYLSFPSGLRGDILDEQTLRKFKQAGVFKINYAIETASPRIQQLVKKRVKLDKLREVIALTHKVGIWAHGFFMLGFPTETKEEVEMTIDYACSSKLNTAGFFVLQPYPGTDIWNQIREMGIDLEFNAETMNYFQSNYKVSELTPDELAQAVKRANRRFYINPARTLSTLARLPHKYQFFTLAFIFMQRALGLNKLQKGK